MLFALRMYPSKTVKSPYERYVGNEPIIIKKLQLTSRSSPISGPKEVKLSTSEFKSGQASAIVVRERVWAAKWKVPSRKERKTP